MSLNLDRPILPCHSGKRTSTPVGKTPPRIDLRSLHCPLPPDHDDHNGSPDWYSPDRPRRGYRLRSPPPLGIAIVGGLLFSQILTLYLTPVFYIYMEQLRDRLGKPFGRFNNPFKRSRTKPIPTGQPLKQ